MVAREQPVQRAAVLNRNKAAPATIMPHNNEYSYHDYCHRDGRAKLGNEDVSRQVELISSASDAIASAAPM